MTFEPNENHPSRKKARVRTVTQHAVEGALPLRVSMPESYIGNRDITFDWGPIHLVLRDEGAVRSFAEGLFELLQVADHAYPNLDAELERQRLEKRRERERDGLESPIVRALRNGGLTEVERSMLEARAQAEFGATSDPGAPDRQGRQKRARTASDEIIMEIGRAAGYELSTYEIERIRQRAGTVSLAEERRVNAAAELGARVSRIDELAFELLARSGAVADPGMERTL